MSRIDHSKLNSCDRMRRQGVDQIDDFGLPPIPAAPKRRPSKSQMRAEAAEAVAKITRIVRCAGCGHSASIALPPSKLNARLRCSKCGEIAK